MSLRLPSPLFVGGGTVEGQIQLRIKPDSKKKSKGKQLRISQLSVDVIGVEETGDGKRHIFLSLATELFDTNHPPPAALIKSQTADTGSELLWETRPARAVIPFCINLPIKLGPPPYLSKNANVRYILCPTASFRLGEKQVLARQTWNVQMLTIHDPERALGSLPTPLLASDTLLVATSPEQSVKLTAGLHRQTWVNGGFLFADIHVVNGTVKPIKKIELFLEKTTLFYSHTAAGTADKSASYLRLPKRNETEIVSTTMIKQSKSWSGVQAQSSEVRTCELELPKGHVTISSGRYFEVRYYVRILITLSMFKSLAVQLPITIIHLNSLDILPNALAQVAASVEAKRARTLPLASDRMSNLAFCPGQAFAAPRRQSLEKHKSHHQYHTSTLSRTTQDTAARPGTSHSAISLKGIRNTDASASPANIHKHDGRSSIASHHHLQRHPSCYHCHLIHVESMRPGSSHYAGPRLPRLQVSTSGLGFSESEFEVPPDSPPRKVMLSERERQMINQQRELRTQRQWSANAGCNVVGDRRRDNRLQPGFVGYRNVAAAVQTSASQSGLARTRLPPFNLDERRAHRPMVRALTTKNAGNRRRSLTITENLPGRLSFGNSERCRDEIRSMDRGTRRTRFYDPMDDGAVFDHPKASSGLVRLPSLHAKS